MKNVAHLDNFKTVNAVRFAVVDVTDELDGARYFEFSSAKTIEQTKERFYTRYMFRETDREMMMNAQKRNSLKLMKIDGSERKLIENNLLLIA